MSIGEWIERAFWILYCKTKNNSETLWEKEQNISANYALVKELAM